MLAGVNNDEVANVTTAKVDDECLFAARRLRDFQDRIRELADKVRCLQLIRSVP